jgi:hypothetical protein
MFVRMVLLALSVSVVFYLAGKRAPSDLLATLIGSSLGVALIVPMGIARDKMEGTLEFICGLPVHSRDIAASRFAAVALLALPWAVVVGVFSRFAPALGMLSPAGAGAVTWIALFFLGACATALLTRFDFESLLGAPVVIMVLLVVLVPRAVHALIPGMSAGAILQILNQPAAPAIFGAGLLISVGATCTAAFVVTARGFANYRHR